VGLAAARANRGARLESEGLGSLSPARGLEALGRLMREDRVQVSVLPWDLARWRRSQPGLATRPLLADLLAHLADPGGGPLDASAVLRTLRSAPGAERPRLLETHLREQVARTLRMDPSQLTVDRPLNSLGLDSLMAMELRKRVETSLGLSLPVVRLLKGPSITELARELLSHLATEDALEAVLAPAAAAPAADDTEWEVVRL
jgi:aryl carrier-like protein